MQYAESLLLCGQILGAEEVDEKTYKELVPVCPHSKKEVKLLSYPSSALPGYEKLPFLHTWVHSKRISCSESTKYNQQNKILQNRINELNNTARVDRINLLKPNLLKLIKKSAVFEQPATIGSLDNLFDRGLIHWFIQLLIELIRDKSFQDSAGIGCRNLYDNCIKESMVDKSSYFYQFVDSNFTAYNHKIYGSQIASEMLVYALANFQGQEIIELIYLGVNEPVQKLMRVAADKISMMAAAILEPDEESEFWELWEADKYQGMNMVKALAKKSPNLSAVYKKYISEVVLKFTINLCLIFWFVPWLEELKTINQETQTQ